MKTMKLGQIGPVRMNKRILKRQTSDNGDVPFYKISTFGYEADAFISKELFDEYREKYAYPKIGDVLISAAGTIGKTVIFDGKPAYFQDSNIVWIENDESEVLNGYLYYYFQTKPWQSTESSTIKRLYNDDLKNMVINVPDLEYQAKVVETLKSFDDKIQTNQTVNRNLLETMKLLYKRWFLQFDFPNEEGLPYKTSGGQLKKDPTFELDVPLSWSVKRLRETIEVEKSGDWGKDSAQGNYSERVNVIRGADLKSLVDGGELKTPERFILKKNIEKKLREKDLVIEISGGSPTQSTGRIAYISKEVLGRFENPVVSSNFTKAISLIDTNMFEYFYLTWQLLYDSDVFFRFEGKTSGIKNLLFEQAARLIPIVVPDEKTLRKFNEIVGPLFSQIQSNNYESQNISRMRDYLTPMLISGQAMVR